MFFQRLFPHRRINLEIVLSFALLKLQPLKIQTNDRWKWIFHKDYHHNHHLINNNNKTTPLWWVISVSSIKLSRRNTIRLCWILRNLLKQNDRQQTRRINLETNRLSINNWFQLSLIMDKNLMSNILQNNNWITKN